MLLKGYEVIRPTKGTKIHKRGSSRYVYAVLETKYHPDVKYNTDKRTCIGKMVDGSDTLMIPNEKFELYYPELMECPETLPTPPKFSDTLKAGAFIAIHRILDKSGMAGILDTVYGLRMSSDIENLISYIVVAQSSTFQHYPQFMRSHLQIGDDIRSDSYLSKLLREGIAHDRIMETLRLWNKLHDGLSSVYVGYDSTNFNTSADGVEFAEYGKAKDDPSIPQVNFAMAVSQADSTPLYYDLYPGSIVDMSECDRMVEQMSDYGYKKVGFLFDRGYFTPDNVRYLDRKGYQFMMMLKENRLVRSLINEQADRLRDQTECFLVNQNVSGVTIRRKLYDDDKNERYFHIYYDDVRAGHERRRFLAGIAQMESELRELAGKKLRKNANLKRYEEFFNLNIEETEAAKGRKKGVKERVLLGYEKKSGLIRELKESYGFFVILSTEGMDAAEALEIYRNRDNIEKLFRSIKSGMGFDTPGVHDGESLTSKIYLIFLATIVWNSLYQITRLIKKETKNKKDFTVPAVIDMLEAIECTVNINGVYKRRYALTAKQKLVLTLLDVDEEYIDKEIQGFQLMNKTL